MTLRTDRVRTSGLFSLDGQDFEVENNIWLLGDDHRVIVVDAAHDAGPILDAIGGREVLMIVATHAHNDHINVAAEVANAVDCPIALHPADRMLWDVVYPDRQPDIDLADGDRFDIGGHRLEVLHTPGHSPGGVCLHLVPEGAVFSGDTLFQGGPGATGRSFSDFPTILQSISGRLGALPADTVVYTGHGDTTSIGDEIVHYDDWAARGH